MSQTEVERAMFYTHQTNGACAGVRVRMRSHASNGEDWDIANIYKGMCKTPKYALIGCVSHLNKLSS